MLGILDLLARANETKLTLKFVAVVVLGNRIG